MNFFRIIFGALAGFFGGLFKLPLPVQQAPAAPVRRSYPVVAIPRWSGADRPPPMMWKDCNPRTRSVFKAELTCSSGHGVSLRNHSVAADGAVNPSVVCLTPGCGFHEIVRLEGWSAGPL